MEQLTILGSTGSIGASTLDVVARNRERFAVFALTGCDNVERMADQCRRFTPRYAVMADEGKAAQLAERLEAGSPVEVLGGVRALVEVAQAPEVDTVMAAIVGAAGLMPTLAAAVAGKRILLANKESLVMSGEVLMDAVKRSGATLLPVDSEHNAIFQCLPPGFDGDLAAAGIVEILLTASGGPFLRYTREQMAQADADQACAHPNWRMGRKISVDSATMMNKGLEVIEACWLFGADVTQISVVVHPQSVVHSLVAYEDGSILAQLGSPDMRTPIASALAWPRRIASGVRPLSLFEVARLEFEAPDWQRFPCLKLAFDVARSGGGASAVLNAANEVAVGAFLDGKMKFTDIPVVIEETLAHVAVGPGTSLDDILETDRQARQYAASLAKRLTS